MKKLIPVSIVAVIVAAALLVIFLPRTSYTDAFTSLEYKVIEAAGLEISGSTAVLNFDDGGAQSIKIGYKFYKVGADDAEYYAANCLPDNSRGEYRVLQALGVRNHDSASYDVTIFLIKPAKNECFAVYANVTDEAFALLKSDKEADETTAELLNHSDILASNMIQRSREKSDELSDKLSGDESLEQRAQSMANDKEALNDYLSSPDGDITTLIPSEYFYSPVEKTVTGTAFGYIIETYPVAGGSYKSAVLVFDVDYSLPSRNSDMAKVCVRQLFNRYFLSTGSNKTAALYDGQNCRIGNVGFGFAVKNVDAPDYGDADYDAMEEKGDFICIMMYGVKDDNGELLIGKTLYDKINYCYGAVPGVPDSFLDMYGNGADNGIFLKTSREMVSDIEGSNVTYDSDDFILYLRINLLSQIADYGAPIKLAALIPETNPGNQYRALPDGTYAEGIVFFNSVSEGNVLLDEHIYIGINVDIYRDCTGIEYVDGMQQEGLYLVCTSEHVNYFGTFSRIIAD